MGTFWSGDDKARGECQSVFLKVVIKMCVREETGTTERKMVWLAADYKNLC
jgi:hypothetical protein